MKPLEIDLFSLNLSKKYTDSGIGSLSSTITDDYVPYSGATNDINVGSHAIHVGDETNYTEFGGAGCNLYYAGDCLKYITSRPALVNSQTKISDNKPTEVYRGCNVGYSFPIFAGDDEELYCKLRVPARWDGVTNPEFFVVCTLTGNEDVGDKFKFQFEWQVSHKGNVMGTTTSAAYSEQTILTGRTAAHNIYTIVFTLDADDVNNTIVGGYMMQGRLRRVASSGTEVSNEIAVWDWAAKWPLDKAYGIWSTSSNDS